jgi:flagellar basal-body rod modification protein FlgD
MTTVQNKPLPDSLLEAMNSKKETAKSGAVAAQDRFMTLLVTQMRNQDPLNPLDNAQVTSQLAQLSTVTGVDKLNSTMEMMMGSYQSSQTLQAANLIGRGVLAPGSDVQLVDGKAILGFELAEPVDNVKVTVFDASGKEVRTLDLGAQQDGTFPITWDGKAADGSTAVNGTYSFAIAATRGGEKVESTPLQFGVVGTVEGGKQGVKLNVPNLGAVNFADVRQIL